MTADQGLVRRLENAQERYVPLPADAAGSVVIDVERARAAVQKLQDMIVTIREARAALDPFLLVSPAADAVSRNAADAAAVMVGACRSYLEVWIVEMNRGAEALQQQISAYQNADRHIGGQV